MGFRSVLTKAFPFISAGASLGGPLGTLAANAVGQALGISKVDPSPEGIEAAIAQAQIKDPDALSKLQEAEQNFKLQMTKLGFENVQQLLQIDAEDRANARARQIAVKDRMPAILAVTLVSGFFVMIAVLLKWGVPETVHDLILLMIGQLSAKFSGVYDYFFGSSSGSAAKQQTIAQIATTKQ